MSETTVTIQIRIRGFDAGRDVYPVEARLEPGGLFFGDLQLDQERLLIQQLDAKAYGTTLSDALFKGAVRDAYKEAIGRAAGISNGQLRVRLWIDTNAAELQHKVAWERLYNESASRPVPLATSADTPFSRYISLDIADPQPVDQRPLRLLVAISNPNNLPSGLAEVRVEEELLGLSQALGDLSREGQVEVTVLPGRTELPAGVRQQLAEAHFNIVEGITSLSHISRHLQNKHVLHFLGHGLFQADKGEGGRASLYLEKDEGAWQAVGDESIVEQLGNLRPQPLLIFLAACESGKGAGQGPFAGLGPKLVQAGIPAVVAMREQVEVGMARDLTRDFYRRLLDHGEVDRALNEARNLLLGLPAGDWSIPVLYMRLRDGRLLTQAPEARPNSQNVVRPQPVDTSPPEANASQRTYTAGPLDLESRVRIRKSLVQYFNVAELKNICADLGIDYENFPDTKDGMARELLLYCERRGLVPALVDVLRQARPGVDW